MSDQIGNITVPDIVASGTFGVANHTCFSRHGFKSWLCSKTRIVRVVSSSGWMQRMAVAMSR